MSGALFLAVFLACAVEAVEAVTIVLAAGVTHGWGQAVKGTLLGVALLVALVGIAAPVLSAVPLRPLRVVMGAGMLYYGWKWLRKAVLRAAGRKALHNENQIFIETRNKALGASRGAGVNIAFGGVMMEGLECVVIVLGLSVGNWLAGASAALLAIITAAALGAVVRRPLARVPENSMKFVVGTMLVAFGMFWLGEGVGVPWPGADLSLIGLVGLVFGAALLATRLLRQPEHVAIGFVDLGPFVEAVTGRATRA